MFLEITDVRAHRDSGMLYVKVSFWLTKIGHDNGNPPVYINDHLMQLRRFGTRIVTNASGWPQRLSDGAFIDPATLTEEEIASTAWATEQFTYPLLAMIISNILDAWREFKASVAAGRRFPTDHTWRDVPLMDTDPEGILQLADIIALRGYTREEAGL